MRGSVAGICMVKDEADIISYTLARMSPQLDFIIIADNMSTDGTRDILEDFRRPELEIIDDPDPAYVQSEKMTGLANLAKIRDAEWVVPFDADEVWRIGGGVTISEALRDVPNDYAKVTASLYDHIATGYDDQSIHDPIARMEWRRSHPCPLHKVACRTLPGLVIEMGNHNCHYPGEVGALFDGIEIRHFPYRSGKQMARKARNGSAAYAAAGHRVPVGAGQHWRDYGKLIETYGEEAIFEVFNTWFYSETPDKDETLTRDPVPAL